MCAASQIVRSLPPALRTLDLDAAQALEGGLQIVQTTGSFALLQVCIARGTRTHAIVRQSHELTSSNLQHFGFELRILHAIALQLAQQRQVQVSPFAHGLGQPITLLPAMSAVLGRPLLLFGASVRLLVVILRAQATLERVQHSRNMIDELVASARGCRRDLGVEVGSETPCREQRLSSIRQMVGERTQLHSRPFWIAH